MPETGYIFMRYQRIIHTVELTSWLENYKSCFLDPDDSHWSNPPNFDTIGIRHDGYNVLFSQTLVVQVD